MARLLINLALVFFISFLWSIDTLCRPCTPQELKLHNMVPKGVNPGQCFKSDPHPLPYGINYPKMQLLSNNYLYLLNLTGKDVDIETKVDYSRAKPEAGLIEEELESLSPNKYYWMDPHPDFDLKLTVGNTSHILDVNINDLKKEGSCIYHFYVIALRNNKIEVKELPENKAVILLKKMQYQR